MLIRFVLLAVQIETQEGHRGFDNEGEDVDENLPAIVSCDVHEGKFIHRRPTGGGGIKYSVSCDIKRNHQEDVDDSESTTQPGHVPQEDKVKRVISPVHLLQLIIFKFPEDSDPVP